VETLRTISGISLLRDSSGFLVRTTSAQLLLSSPPPATFQGVTIRPPRKPQTPQPRLQCLLHGVETEETTGALKDELLRQLGEGSVISVERFHRRTDAGPNKAQPLTTVRVTVAHQAAYNKLLSRDFRLFDLLQVRSTALGEQASLPHCSRCLQWGHRAHICPNESGRITRCYRCGEGGHLEASCSAPASAPKCHNCGGSHATRYRGCRAHKEATSIRLLAPTLSPSRSSALLDVHQPPPPEFGEQKVVARRGRANPLRGRASSYANVTSSGTTGFVTRMAPPPASPRVTRSVSASAIPRPIVQSSRKLTAKPCPPPKPSYLRTDLTTSSPPTDADKEEAYQLLERAIRVLVPPREAVLLSQVIRLLIRARAPPAST
jgi:hypothetical protein